MCVCTQDKSRSLVACAVRPLLREKCDVLMVGSFSAHTVAHVAVQAAACSGCVHVCGVLNPIIQEELQTTFSSIGCTSECYAVGICTCTFYDFKLME